MLFELECQVAFMTVQTDGSSAANDTGSVLGCCHTVLMAVCSHCGPVEATAFLP